MTPQMPGLLTYPLKPCIPEQTKAGGMLDLMDWYQLCLGEKQLKSGYGMECHYNLGEYFLFIPLILALPGSCIADISLLISEVKTSKQKGGCLLCRSASYIVWS